MSNCQKCLIYNTVIRVSLPFTQCAFFINMSGEKRKLDIKSSKEKYKALKDLEKGLLNKNVAVKYGISRNTVSTWLKNKEKIVSAFESGKNPKRLKLKTAENDNLDKYIYKWFLSAREQMFLLMA